MKSKTKELSASIAAGDVSKSISIASKFFDRSEDTKLFKQAKSASENPGFYHQIGKDPQLIIDEAWSRMKERFAGVQ